MTEKKKVESKVANKTKNSKLDASKVKKSNKSIGELQTTNLTKIDDLRTKRLEFDEKQNNLENNTNTKTYGSMLKEDKGIIDNLKNANVNLNNSIKNLNVSLKNKENEIKAFKKESADIFKNNVAAVKEEISTINQDRQANINSINLNIEQGKINVAEELKLLKEKRANKEKEIIDIYNKEIKFTTDLIKELETEFKTEINSINKSEKLALDNHALEIKTLESDLQTQKDKINSDLKIELAPLRKELTIVEKSGDKVKIDEINNKINQSETQMNKIILELEKTFENSIYTHKAGIKETKINSIKSKIASEIITIQRIEQERRIIQEAELTKVLEQKTSDSRYIINSKNIERSNNELLINRKLETSISNAHLQIELARQNRLLKDVEIDYSINLDTKLIDYKKELYGINSVVSSTIGKSKSEDQIDNAKHNIEIAKQHKLLKDERIKRTYNQNLKLAEESLRNIKLSLEVEVSKINDSLNNIVVIHNNAAEKITIDLLDKSKIDDIDYTNEIEIVNNEKNSLIAFKKEIAQKAIKLYENKANSLISIYDGEIESIKNSYENELKSSEELFNKVVELEEYAIEDSSIRLQSSNEFLDTCYLKVNDVHQSILDNSKNRFSDKRLSEDKVLEDIINNQKISISEAEKLASSKRNELSNELALVVKEQEALIDNAQKEFTLKKKEVEKIESTNNKNNILGLNKNEKELIKSLDIVE